MALGLVFIVSLLVSQAQKLRLPVKVSSVAVQSSSRETLISVAADGSLGNAQTWQDSEGYHLVLPGTVAAESVAAPRGVKIRRLGTSLEVLVQTKAGAKVNAHVDGNRIQLSVEGKLLPRETAADRPTPGTFEDQLFENRAPTNQTQTETPPLKFSSTVEDLSAKTQVSVPEAVPAATPAGKTNPAAIVPTEGGTNSDSDPAPAQITVQPQDEGWMASVFSGTSVLIVFGLGLFGLLVNRKMRSRQDVVMVAESPSPEEWEAAFPEAENNGHGKVPNAGTSLAPVESGTNGSSRSPVVRLPVAGATSLYGAYRIDQEVGKLILGQPHRLDVLSSRAIEDRRAIEASLIKGVNSTQLDDSARRRAREALEEYGFVARQCATLLLATDPFDRTSAARFLGDIKSPASLPFLLESLYDSESIVRNQAVVSIGELKIPSAIGALLDIARTHPDVPSSLLSRTLSACSVEGLDFLDAVPEPGLLGTGAADNIVEQITHLEPATPVEDLPEGSDDPALARAFVALESENVEERAEALKTLAQFPVQSAVGAISVVAREDSEPAIRSQAISSLGSINHQSVFPGILLGLSDEAREVRAAAARSLNRLSFDRADAYARVIESSDDETIQAVAKACIQAGIVSQNLDRLSASDHRQAYETFTLICLLAKARINEPILDAIANHPKPDVRIKAVHLLACTGQPEVVEQLRELAVSDGMREDVKTALLDAMYRLDRGKAAQPEMLEAELVPEAPFEEVVEENAFEEEIEETETMIQGAIFESEMETENLKELEF